MARPQSTLNACTVITREQPWKAFWPPRTENFTEAQLNSMPWLAWEKDSNQASEKPWRSWVLKNQSSVRRGSTVDVEDPSRAN
jgi:hypothetical protein